MTSTPAVCHCVICWTYVDNDYPDPLVGRWNGMVREHGWTPIGVTGDASGVPGWAHTLGLWHSYRLPELVIFGAPENLQVRLLKYLVDQILAGQEMPEGTVVDIQGGPLPPMTLMHVVDGWNDVFLGSAVGFYRQTPKIPFLQISHGGDEPRLWLGTDEHPLDKWRDQLRLMPLKPANPREPGR